MSTPRMVVTADLGDGPQKYQATGVSIDRSLSGGALPGQARVATGTAVTEASATLRLHDPEANPWRDRVTTGGLVTIEVADDDQADLQPMAKLQVRRVNGVLGSSAVTVVLEDPVAGGRVPVVGPSTTAPTYTYSTTREAMGFDACAVIDLAARSMGFHQTPPPVPGALFCVHGTGSFIPEVGTLTLAPDAAAGVVWGTTLDGHAYLAGNTALHAWAADPFDGADRVDLWFTFTPVRRSSGSGSPELRLRFIIGGVPGASTDYEMVVSSPGNSAQVTVRGVRGSVPAWTTAEGAGHRVQVRVVWDLRAGVATVWARDEARAFSDPVTINPPPVTGDLRLASCRVGYLLGVQVTTADDPGLWAPPTARITSSGFTVPGIVFPARDSALRVAQDAAAATLGALWFAEDGVLVYRGWREMTGAGRPVQEVIHPRRSLDGLGYSLDGDGASDRVEIGYQSMTTLSAADGPEDPTAWTSSEAVEVPAGGSVVVEAVLDGVAVYDLKPFRPLWDGTAPRWSRWAAATSPSGGGAQPVNTALQIEASQQGPGRVLLTIRNTTATPLWTVDGNGAPALILRAERVVRVGERKVVAVGASESDAVSPLRLDVGPYMPDQVAVAQVADWVAALTGSPVTTFADVAVTPRAGRREGDLVILDDEDRSGLLSKAVISRMTTELPSGSFTQRCTFTLLDTLVPDVDAWAAELREDPELPGGAFYWVDRTIADALGADATIGEVEAWLGVEVVRAAARAALEGAGQ